MINIRCLITEKFQKAGIELLQKHCIVDIKYGISRQGLINSIKKYDILIVRSDTLVDKELIDSGENLKVIGMSGIGLNHIDTKYAKEKNIAVFNVSDGSVDAVAELTVGMMISIARKAYLAVRDTKQGIWNKTGYYGNQLRGKTLGLIAMGKIGCKVATICQSIGMKVIAYDPYLDCKSATEINVELHTMEDVLKNSDFISIHSPLTKETYRMIGKNEIKLMKKGAYIINLGRGGIIDEDELYKALVENRIAGAALDVLEKEPPQDTKLLGLDNVIVTPHTGAGTMEAQNYISISLANQVLEYMNSFRWNKF